MLQQSYNKYIKYKTEYLNLKKEINDLENKLMIGGKKISKWDKKERAREKELDGMKNTKSFVSVTKLSNKNKEYLIHDNGDRPFKVIVSKDAIDVYECTKDKEQDKIIYKKIILHITNFLGYFNGFDASPHKLHGNSILVRVNDKKYIYIGSEIYSFNVNEVITDYISYMGNSDVPYPVAYSEKYVYFLLDKQMILREEFEIPVSIANAGKLYGEFYGHIGPKNHSHKKIKMEDVKILCQRKY